MRDKTERKDEQHEAKLPGTFVSVLVLAGIILVSWLLVFYIFIDREGG